MTTKRPSQSVDTPGDALNFEYIYKITSETPSKLDVEDRSQPVLDVSALDNVSQYMHMSLPAQLPGTLNAFFPTQTSESNVLHLLKCRVDRFKADECRWETAALYGGPRDGEGLFPHLFLKNDDGSPRLWLKVSEIDSVRQLVSPQGDLGWEKQLDEIKDWLT